METDDLAPARGICDGVCNVLLIEFAAFVAIVAVWVLWWAALPGITT